MRRWTILIMVATSLALATAPAAAKPKPPDPPPPAELAEVTMTLADPWDGLAGVLDMKVETSRGGVVEYLADGTGGVAPRSGDTRPKRLRGHPAV